MPGTLFILTYFIIFVPHGFCKKHCTDVPKNCPTTKYRSFDGSCNNLKHPDWGMPNITFRRLLPPEYGNGISSYRLAKSGKDLPNARKVSEIIFPGITIEDKIHTLALMQYGQIITHDLARVGAIDDNYCCTADLQFLDKTKAASNCAPITVPANDSYYTKIGAKCISFAKTLTDRDLKCDDGEDKPVQQINRANSFLDLSIIYGSDNKTNGHIRLNQRGLLKTRKFKGQEWPLESENIDEDCALSPKDKTCFYPSDVRINQHPQLTVLHIVFYREHNRIARELARLNPHWDDNTLFEETRKINIAEHQYISFYEWLPLFWNITNSGIELKHYDPDVDPSTLNEFNNAAFRIHTQIAGRLELVEEDRHVNDTIQISDVYFRPYILEKHNNFDSLARGLTSQMGLAADEYHDYEITHLWFKRKTKGYDLRAIDIERSRDNGLPSYNKMRAFLKLPVAKTFQDLEDIPKEIAMKLSTLYETVDDLDLIVGGAVEKTLPGSAVGPTFQSIIFKQFQRTRVGDRFWFENGGETGFTLDQLREIRTKTTLSKLMCDNTKDIEKMQPQGFLKIGKLNAMVDCETLPSINLSLWKAEWIIL